MAGEEDLPLGFGFLLAPQSGKRKHTRYLSARTAPKDRMSLEICVK